MTTEPRGTTPGKRVRYTRGEKIVLWLCWLTPGIAVGSVLYLEWWLQRHVFAGTQAPSWHEPLYHSAIVIVLLGSAIVAGAICAAKSEREQLALRTTKFALLFILVQVLLAPLTCILAAVVVFGR